MLTSKDVMNKWKASPNQSENLGAAQEENALRDRFHAVVQENNIAECRKRLAAGIDPNVMHRGKTALGIAAAKGHIDMVKLLVKHRADLNQKDVTTKPPLLHALLNEHYHVMKFLIKAGCDVDSRDGPVGGKTCLFFAVDRGLIPGIKVLLASNCNVNLPGLETPLHRACERSNVDVVRLLLGAGADPSCPNFVLRYPPLHVAAAKDNLDIVRLLIPVSRVNTTGRQHHTAVHMAAMAGKAESIRLLALAGWSTNMKDSKGKSPLFMALEKNHLSCVKVLVENGCNVDQVHDNRTALHIAASNDDLELATILLKGGANPNSLSLDSHITPLAWAASEGSLRVIKFLLRYGADPGITDHEGKSPLLLAVQEGHQDVIDVLMDAGVGITLPAVYQQIYMDFLRTNYPEETCEWMVEALNKPTSLKCLSRQVIRQTVLLSGGHFPENMEHLPLPTTLKDYLLFLGLTNAYN